MLKICKNMARTEHKWESTKRRLTFWRIFLEILPYKSFTKFGVCSKEDEKKKTIFLAIFCYFSWNKKQIHAQKTFFLESTSCKTTAPHNFNADQLNGSGTYLYHAEWLRQKRVKSQEWWRSIFSSQCQYILKRNGYEIYKMITSGKILWSIIKFSQLIL